MTYGNHGEPRRDGLTACESGGQTFESFRARHSATAKASSRILAATPRRRGSQPKISKTTPCKVAGGRRQGRFGPILDASGKSAALLHHRTIRETPVVLVEQLAKLRLEQPISASVTGTSSGQSSVNVTEARFARRRRGRARARPRQTYERSPLRSQSRLSPAIGGGGSHRCACDFECLSAITFRAAHVERVPLLDRASCCTLTSPRHGA